MTNKKLMVLIADDEFRIGMLIKKIINWDDLNLECIDIVNNGELALKTIQEKNPDIVITDIRMPRINGLDLIAKVKEKYPNIKFIVISGYKDFEYAHKALQYGVSSYLLKPINGVELNSALKKITLDLNEDYMKKNEEEIHKKEIYASKQIIKKNILKSIIDSQTLPSLSEVWESYNLSLSSPIYRAIDIKLDYLDLNKINKRQDFITVTKIISIVEKAFEEQIQENLIYADSQFHIYCLFNYAAPKSKDVISIINNVLIEIEEYLLGFEYYEVTIGIGNEKTLFANTLDSIHEAYRSVANRIKIGTGRLIYATNINTSKEPIVSNLLSTYSERYASGIHSYSIDEFRKCIDDIFADISQHTDIDFSCYYILSAQLINEFFEHIQEKSQEGKKLKQHLLDVSQHCFTISKLKNLIKSSLSEYLGSQHKILQVRSTKPIREAKKYIDENYNKKITLEDIAKIVNLNPVYFSVLFKKETGLNFSAYIINVKMQEAKNMLKNTNETIAAIAGTVGYKDVRYFSRLFTKTIGVKPAIFRKLYS